MRTARFCVSGGVHYITRYKPLDTLPPGYPTLPEGTWDQIYPTLQKVPGTRATLHPVNKPRVCKHYFPAASSVCSLITMLKGVHLLHSRLHAWIFISFATYIYIEFYEFSRAI